MTRAAISMPSNVAEGCSRSSKKEIARYFEISIGSAFELETQILAGQNIKYFEYGIAEQLVQKVQEFQRKTNSYRMKILS